MQPAMYSAFPLLTIAYRVITVALFFAAIHKPIYSRKPDDMTYPNKQIPKDKQPAFSPEKPGNSGRMQPEHDFNDEPVEEKAIKTPPVDNDNNRSNNPNPGKDNRR